jgi:RNA polymerase sigma-70 factor (ECF subfamily)
LGSDHRDYESLIQPIEDQMIRSVWRIVRDPDDFNDAFQGALATIWKHVSRIRRHPNPHALILRICVNAAYDVLRRKARRRRREALEAITANLPDPAPSVAERLQNKEKRAEIFRAISQLPRNQAEAILMRFAQELSYSDIAQALGCSEVTARTHVSRARAWLCKRLAHLAPHSPKEAMKG